ncbi:mechanosensitive ion channel family protein [Geomonas sp.]|uniref:mechanosensitive ion channel family protein n=1 Tax=Geomonas sp. TaxID=2651584 RepID=UPI002B48673E|nr:mechanosensitive ion channel family protein [Geomonas sp.]HJV35588.1 mechanosensitive ion channel family protein [Geomonas sp.]
MLAVWVILVALAVPAWGEAAPPVQDAKGKEAPVQTAPAKEIPPQTTPAKAVAVPMAPVMLGGNRLFSYPGYHTLSPEERAARISERITRLAEDETIRTAAITAVDGDDSTDIMADGRGIMAIFESDARAFAVSRQQLARTIVGELRAAIDQYREARAPKNIVHGVVKTAIATLLLLVVLFLMRMLFRKFLVLLASGKVRAIHFQNFEVLRLEQVRSILIAGMRGLRLVIVLVLLYLYLHVVLGFFPWTRPFSGQILSYLLVPLQTMEMGVLDYIPNLIFLVVLSLVSYYVIKFMRLISVEVEKGNIAFPGFYREWAKPTYKIARFLFIAFVAVVAFPYFPGSNSPAFKGITIFLGVLLSLGSSSTVSNIIAGLDMTYRRAFIQGDWIKIGDLVGQVARTRLLVTHLKTFKNEEVVFPNASLLNSHVTNFSSLAREHGLILHSSITIGYNTPWRQVHAFLLQAAQRTSGLLQDPPPFVLQTALDDFYVRYELNAYTSSPERMLDIYSELHQHIQDAFNEFEVQIMSPHYVFDPKSPAVVPKERWYVPPAAAPGEPSGPR